ncbi:MAG: ATP-binding protein [Clostridia bacterium]|nr:ATP-binding protein [Clostridia bacterium]
MLNLIIGLKGSGKTKNLIRQLNEALDKTNGNVVCIEQGEKLRYDVKYTARLVNTDEYGVKNGDQLFGLIAGIVASNSDVTDIFVDGVLRICKSKEDFESVLPSLEKLADRNKVRLVMTCSVSEEDAGEVIAKYI